MLIRSWNTANTPRAARCWICSRWAASCLIVWISLMTKSTACVCLIPTPSARWKKSMPLICFPRTNSRLTKRPSSYSVVSGAIPLRLNATPNIFISRSAKARYLRVLNTGNRCFSASRCRRCSATSLPIRYWSIPVISRPAQNASRPIPCHALKIAVLIQCARFCRRNRCGCGLMSCFLNLNAGRAFN